MAIFFLSNGAAFGGPQRTLLAEDDLQFDDDFIMVLLASVRDPFSTTTGFLDEDSPISPSLSGSTGGLFCEPLSFELGVLGIDALSNDDDDDSANAAGLGTP